MGFFNHSYVLVSDIVYVMWFTELCGQTVRARGITVHDIGGSRSPVPLVFGLNSRQYEGLLRNTAE